MTQPLTEKYRPMTLDQITGNIDVITCLKSFDLTDIPNMLFYGPPGTGKTTAIRALLHTHPFQNILELNASDARGIDVVRGIIKEFSETCSPNLRVVILDEADNMSRDAQGALRRIMEDYTNTRFCLICNYARKIIEPIRSRCTRFRFTPVRQSSRLQEICLKENIIADQEGLELIVDFGDGDMRKMINDIQGLAATYSCINRKNTLEFFGLPDERMYNELYDYLRESTFDVCKKFILDNEMDTIGLIQNLTKVLIKAKHKNKLQIMSALADIEHRMGNGCTDGVQLNALIGAFIINRE